MSDDGGGDSVWIGMQDYAGRHYYQWSDRSKVDYTKWHPSEPNNYGGRHEGCVSIYKRVIIQKIQNVLMHVHTYEYVQTCRYVIVVNYFTSSMLLSMTIFVPRMIKGSEVLSANTPKDRCQPEHQRRL